MSIVVVMPSRGRPQRARDAIQAIRDTAALVSTSVILVVDADDPELPRYLDIGFTPYGAEVTTIVLSPEETGSLVRATNTVSLRVARADPTAIIGNLGDDHLVRTPGWDKLIAAALERPGIAYGDDLIQGEQLPTAPFISASIVLALGWYALPTLDHMYIDDVWRELGRRAGSLHYLPDVVIEHMHPGVGKADWDESYRRTNADEAILLDRDRYQAWLAGPAAADIATVAALG